MRTTAVFFFATIVLASACTQIVPSDTSDDDDDDDGADAGPELPDPPPPNGEAIVLAPRHGQVVDDRRVLVEGLVTTAGADLQVQYWDSSFDAWFTTTRATVTGPSAASEGMFDFEAEVELDAARWPTGGLAHLRVVADGTPAATFDVEADGCVADRPSWPERVVDCASRAAAMTLASPADAPTDDALYLDRKGVLEPEDTRAYYAAIDAPTTLADFVARFDMDDAGTAVATYLNRGDLGIGREMHCDTFDVPGALAGVACFVRNYGFFGGDLDENLDAAIEGHESGVGLGSFATVAMIYTPPADAPNAVQFVVYGPDGTLLDEAQLDTRGDNVGIPTNCLNCHGNASSYDPATLEVTGARFLPFDLDAFEYSTKAGYRRADQEAAFRALNTQILATAPPPGLEEVIRGWYGGGAELAGVADTGFVPPAWDTPLAAPVYREVVAPFCRGCHASRTIADDLTFDTPAQFFARADQIAAFACAADDPDHTMPNAEATLLQFWAGPSRAYLAGIVGAEKMGACVPVD